MQSATTTKLEKSPQIHSNQPRGCKKIDCSLLAIPIARNSSEATGLSPNAAQSTVQQHILPASPDGFARKLTDHGEIVS